LNGQFLSQFIIDSIEMLERIANPEEPPLEFSEISSRHDEVEYAEPEERAEVLSSLDDMEKVFMRGRGSLEQWTPEVLEAIDKCFRTLFMSGEEPVAHLFFPYDDRGIELFNEYCDAVDGVLQANADKIPPYAREYFAYFTIWEKRDYAFPVPLGTASVIECLHKMASRVCKGMIEVSLQFVAYVIVHRTMEWGVVRALRLSCVWERGISPRTGILPCAGLGVIPEHMSSPVCWTGDSRTRGFSRARDWG
jgi:hypothetical protein